MLFEAPQDQFQPQSDLPFSCASKPKSALIVYYYLLVAPKPTRCDLSPLYLLSLSTTTRERSQLSRAQSRNCRKFSTSFPKQETSCCRTVTKTFARENCKLTYNSRVPLRSFLPFSGSLVSSQTSMPTQFPPLQQQLYYILFVAALDHPL